MQHHQQRNKQTKSSEEDKDYPCHQCQHVQAVYVHNASIYKAKRKESLFLNNYDYISNGRLSKQLEDNPSLYFNSGSFKFKEPENFVSGYYRPKKTRRWFLSTLYKCATRCDIDCLFTCSGASHLSPKKFQSFLTTELFHRLPPYKLCAVRVHHKREKIFSNGGVYKWVHSRWVRALVKFEQQHSIQNLEELGYDSNSFSLLKKELRHEPRDKNCYFPTQIPLLWEAVAKQVKTQSALFQIAKKKKVKDSEFTFVLPSHAMPSIPSSSYIHLQTLHRQIRNTFLSGKPSSSASGWSPIFGITQKVQDFRQRESCKECREEEPPQKKAKQGDDHPS